MVEPFRGRWLIAVLAITLALFVLGPGGAEAGKESETLGTSIVTPPIIPGSLLIPLYLGGDSLGPDGGDGSGPGGEPSTTGAADPCAAPCTNTGIQWVNATDVEYGSLRCRSVRVGLIIGSFGIGLGFGYIECPRSSVYTPGHWQRVTKFCFSATPSGSIQSERQRYRCGYSPTPGVTTVDCVYAGPAEVDQTITVYQESPCVSGGGVVVGR